MERGISEAFPLPVVPRATPAFQFPCFLSFNFTSFSRHFFTEGVSAENGGDMTIFCGADSIILSILANKSQVKRKSPLQLLLFRFPIAFNIVISVISFV